MREEKQEDQKIRRSGAEEVEQKDHKIRKGKARKGRSPLLSSPFLIF
jgi:hypothetical protein